MNERRLHRGIDYLTPASVHQGTADRIRAERRSKALPAIGGERKT